MEKSLFVFGLGYSALTLAGRLQREGWRISGTCRDVGKCAALKEKGIDAVPFEAVRSIGAPHILVSIPPQETQGDVVLAHYRGHLLSQPRRWIGYLSTTGVYGDRQGAWVDEDTPVSPNTARLVRRVEAERRWLGLGAHVFRLAGIYGEGRNALVDVREGTAKRIDKPGQVFSRIHVEDVAGVLRASLHAPCPGSIYNVCDDAPAPAHDVVAYACALLGSELPPLIPFEHAALSPMAREFYSANRRVRNAHITQALGYVLRYPTYREGLSALHRQMRED
jgi:nucleoside-diphosphate-sugar epimerase